MRKTLLAIPAALLLALLAWILLQPAEDAAPEAADEPGLPAVTLPAPAELEVAQIRAERAVPGAAPFHNRMIKAGSGVHRLGGVVVDENDQPVPGAWVAAYSVPFPLLDFELNFAEIFEKPLDFSLEPLCSALADQEGRFTLEGAPGRILYVTARALQRLTPRRQRVLPGELDQPDGVTIRTVAAASLSGRVVDENGQAAADVEVLIGPGVKYLIAAFRNRSFFLERAFTAADGSFQIEAVPAGTALTAMAFRGPVQSGTGEFGPLARLAQGSVTVKLEDVGKLSGGVSNAEGEPLSGAMVVAVPIDLRRAIPFIRNPGAWTATSNSQGNYRFDELPRGLYLLIAQGRQGRSTPQTARVAAAASTAETLVVDVKRTVAGRVIDSDGKGVANATVKLQSIPTGGQDLDERALFNQPGGLLIEGVKQILPELLPEAAYVLTDGQGEFRLSAWSQSQVRVSAVGYTEADFDFGDLEEDKKAVLTIYRPGAVDGVVMDSAARKPVPFFLVRGEHRETPGGLAVEPVPSGDELTAVEKEEGAAAAPAPGGAGQLAGDEQLLPPEVTWRANLRASTLADDPQGRFHLEGLPPGRWDFIVQSDGYENGRAAGVEVKAGEVTRGVVVQLSAGATVSGKVLNAGDRRPVAGAVVSVGEGEESGFMAMLQGLGDNLAMAETAADGSFTVRGAGAGDDHVSVMADGYAMASVEIPKLQAFEERSDVVIEVAAGGSITGLVTDRNGTPLPGRMVGAMSVQARDFQQCATNEEGRYLMEHLRPGSYFMLTADLDDEALFTGDVATMLASSRLVTAHVAEGRQTVVDIVDQSAGGCRFAGKLTDKGAAVANANIFAMAAERSGLMDFRFASARTDQNGEFLFKSLAPGEYRFQIQTDEWEGALEVMVPELAEDYVFLEVPQSEVRGNVVEEQSGAPVSGAQVILVSEAEPSGIAALFGGGASREWATTAEDGGFAFKGVSPGRYHVEVSGQRGRGGDEEGENLLLGRVETASFTLLQNEVRHLDLVRLPVGGAIRVKVYDSSGAAFGQWFSLRAVPAGAEDAGEDQVIRGWGNGGEGRISGLSAGSYQVTVEARNQAAVTVHDVTVRAGEVTEISATVAGGVVLKARIVDAQDRPLAADKIVLLNAQGRQVNQDGGFSAAMRRMFNSGDGVQEIGTFPPGSYTLRVTHDGVVREEPVSLIEGRAELVEIRF